MNILDQFGFNWILLVAQIVNFLIVLFILKKFLYKPILTTLNERKHKIETGLKEAKDAEELLAKAQTRENEIIKKAQAEAKEMLEETKKQTALLLSDAELKAKEQAENILRESKLQIESETKEAEKRLTAQVSKLAIDFLQKSLENAFAPSEQKAIMEQAIKKISTKNL